MPLNILLLLAILIGSVPKESFGADAIEQLATTEDDTTRFSETFVERVLKISPYGRIFILSNTQNSYGDGDYLTLILENKRVARALTAKTISEESGIKIVKIYDPVLWRKLREGVEVTLIRGDDSSFTSPTKTRMDGTNPDDVANDIVEEKNLLNKLEENAEIEEESSRNIRTDNIITAAYGRLQSQGPDGNSASYAHWSGMWAYQFYDNFWGEVLYGESLMEGYPNEKLKTKLTNMTIKLKYTVSGPLTVYIKPYVGYQMVKSKSPMAGVDPTGKTSNAELEKEKEMVGKANKQGVILGVSLLKRLVPGWFFKADVGSDLLTLGVAFEF